MSAPLSAPLYAGPLDGGQPLTPAETAAYGVDMIFVASSGGLQVVAGDYALAQGLDNLRASVLRRLLTNPGDWKARPDYGCGVPSYLYKPITDAVLSKLRNDIVLNLSQEDRLTQVTVGVTEIEGASSGLLVSVAGIALSASVSWSFSFTQ